MKICFVHEEYPEETNFGGIATYQKNVAEQFVKFGHIVYVIARGLKTDQEYMENGVHVIRIHTSDTNDQIQNSILYREKVKDKLRYLQDQNLIDIIEVPDWGAETILFEPFRTIPLIVRLHTPLKVWLEYNQNNFGPIKDKMLEWEEEMIHSADCITCCSSALKKKIIQEFFLDESKIIVTPNPCNLKDFYIDQTIKKENRIIYVGSLEQRKGICVLAEALNIVFEKHPNLEIDFIGKDTSRNDQNISTKDLIFQIIHPKYHQNIHIIGQIPNQELNFYLNRSFVGVYPSLFDNFPYVVLEAMASGLHIVGSQNSGMVEMLDDDSSIYQTGNVEDLANKIIEKYEYSQKVPISRRNRKRVKELYNCKKVCQDMIKKYQETIQSFYQKRIQKDDIQEIFHLAGFPGMIQKCQKEKIGVANETFQVTLENQKYLLKRYHYHYRFDLGNDLYQIYEKNQIPVVKPLNQELVIYQHFQYNIFEYIDHQEEEIDSSYYSKLLSIDRTCQKNDMLFEKCDGYYKPLKKMKDYDERLKEPIESVLKIYQKLRKKKKFYGNAINHGDLQRSNILCSQGKYYLIDFDEAIVASPLYDFAVLSVKMYRNNTLERNKIDHLIEEIKERYPSFQKKDYYDMIKLYLCKILLEKYYLHQMMKIDLFSEEQKSDYFGQYHHLLIQEMGENYE